MSEICNEYGWDPWSSGYGRMLMHQKLWVRIPALMDMTYFH